MISFVYFNGRGSGSTACSAYLKHFTGPLLLIAPLFFVIEIIGTFARVLSLSLRLFMNIYGEHTTTGVFASLVPIVVPWPMMALGLFTASSRPTSSRCSRRSTSPGATAHEEH